MDELIKAYEACIRSIEKRIGELRGKSVCRSAETEKRIELLNTERLELMLSAALMRRTMGPKPPSPVYRPEKNTYEGDAAC